MWQPSRRERILKAAKESESSLGPTVRSPSETPSYTTITYAKDLGFIYIHDAGRKNYI